MDGAQGRLPGQVLQRQRLRLHAQAGAEPFTGPRRGHGDEATQGIGKARQRR